MRYVSWIFGAVAAALVCWVLYLSVTGAIEGISVQRHWKPPAKAYAAHIIGFADRGGVRMKVTAPVVEIRFADGTRKEFTSLRSGSLHLLRVGSEVRVLTDTVQMFGRPWEVYEIDSAFELWIKDVLLALGVICLVIGIPLWVFRPLRFRR